MSSDEQWWASAVFYQVYPRSFADSDGDGVGDLPGVTSRLDHLQRLGVDVLWLSPVYPSPQDDNGYDISDYTGIDPGFGTFADFEALRDGLHERGMKLVMDLVVNHTSDEHPWFVESRSSTDNPKRDWYWWRDARPGTVAGEPGAEPTNWESFFSGSTWELDPTTGQYYLHLFSRKQPDLNWENPEVRAAVHDVMRFWLDHGVDGFRMDVINLISKDTALPDGVVAPGARWGDASPYTVCGPRIHEFLAELNREVVAPRAAPVVLVGEMPGVTVEQARRFTDQDRAEVDMVFQFEHVGLDHGRSKWHVRPLPLPVLKENLDRWQRGLAEVGWNSLYWDNHDQPRAVSRFGDDDPAWRERSAKTLATVLHLQRGTPFVYQGEELGLPNATFAGVEDFRDIESVNAYRDAVDRGEDPAAFLAAMRRSSRDNARTPMQWDGSPHAGFTTGTPWLPVPEANAHITAAEQWDDPTSVLHHHRRLITLRHEHPVVVRGSCTLLAGDHPSLYAYERRLDGTRLLVLASFDRDPVELRAVADLDEAWAWAEVLLSTEDGGPAAPLDPLPGWQSRVLRIQA